MKTVLAEILLEVKSISSQSRRWLTVEQLSIYLGLSTSTIYQYVSQNKIPFRKIPNSSRLIFSRFEIDRWIKEGVSRKEVSPNERADELWREIDENHN